MYLYFLSSLIASLHRVPSQRDRKAWKYFACENISRSNFFFVSVNSFQGKIRSFNAHNLVLIESH